jgi:hypothetical protein
MGLAVIRVLYKRSQVFNEKFLLMIPKESQVLYPRWVDVLICMDYLLHIYFISISVIEIAYKASSLRAV